MVEKHHRRWTQFSLRALVLLTLVVSAYCAGYWSPRWISKSALPPRLLIPKGKFVITVVDRTLPPARWLPGDRVDVLHTVGPSDTKVVVPAVQVFAVDTAHRSAPDISFLVTPDEASVISSASAVSSKIELRRAPVSSRSEP